MVMTTNKYGIAIKPERQKVRPAPMDLSGPEGKRIVLAAAKRVIATHAKVLKNLANR